MSDARNDFHQGAVEIHAIPCSEHSITIEEESIRDQGAGMIMNGKKIILQY
jgi:hypothetical protein